MNTINQSINPYLPQTPFTELSVVLQYTFTKSTWPSNVQLDVIQFLPSAGSKPKLLSLKSNNIYYITWFSKFDYERAW